MRGRRSPAEAELEAEVLPMPVIGDDARPGPDPGHRARPAAPRGPGAPALGLPPANTVARPDEDPPPQPLAPGQHTYASDPPNDR